MDKVRTGLSVCADAGRLGFGAGRLSACVFHELTHPVEQTALASSVVASVVAVLAVVFAWIAFGSARKTSRPALRVVGWAFVIFALKNAFVAYNVWTHLVPHDGIELLLSVADLVLLGLLLSPLMSRRGS